MVKFNSADRTLRGKVYRLSYDFEALCDLEDDHPDIMAGKMDAAKIQSPRYVRALIRKGLGDQVADEKEVGALLNDIGIVDAVAWFGEALGYAFAPRFSKRSAATDGDETENPTPAQTPT